MGVTPNSKGLCRGACLSAQGCVVTETLNQMNNTLTSQDLIGKNALVTGASRGIGAAIAIELASRGANVTITYERSSDRAAEVVRAITEKGRRGLAIQADSADPAAVKHSVDEAVKVLGGIDILVNNAGIGRVGKFADISLADMTALWEVNVRAVTLASQAVIPHLGVGGRIISIGSCLAERVPFGGMNGLFANQVRAARLHPGPRARTGTSGNHGQPCPTRTDRYRCESSRRRVFRNEPQPDRVEALRHPGRGSGSRGLPGQSCSELCHRLDDYCGWWSQCLMTSVILTSRS